MNTLCLTHEELADLTDRQTPRAQMQWLAAHGYPFEVSAAGRPKVLRSVVQARLGDPEASPSGSRRSRPRLDLVKG